MIVIFSVGLLLHGGKGDGGGGGGAAGGRGREKIISVLIEFAISLAVPDRWIMNTV